MDTLCLGDRKWGLDPPVCGWMWDRLPHPVKRLLSRNHKRCKLDGMKLEDPARINVYLSGKPRQRTEWSVEALLGWSRLEPGCSSNMMTTTMMMMMMMTTYFICNCNTHRFIQDWRRERCCCMESLEANCEGFCRHLRFSQACHWILKLSGILLFVDRYQLVARPVHITCQAGYLLTL